MRLEPSGLILTQLMNFEIFRRILCAGDTALHRGPISMCWPYGFGDPVLLKILNHGSKKKGSTNIKDKEGYKSFMIHLAFFNKYREKNYSQELFFVPP